MKDLHGTAGATVAAPVPECLALVSDLEGYAAWYPSVVRSVDVLERDAGGGARRARTRVRVPNVPIGELAMTLVLEHVDERAVTLVRETHGADDHEQFRIRWSASPAAPAGSGTRLELQLDATLSVPRLLPTRGLGDVLARGFVAAAAAARQG